jgi:hypothetical protein
LHTESYAARGGRPENPGTPHPLTVPPRWSTRQQTGTLTTEGRVGDVKNLHNAPMSLEDDDRSGDDGSASSETKTDDDVGDASMSRKP